MAKANGENLKMKMVHEHDVGATSADDYNLFESKNNPSYVNIDTKGGPAKAFIEKEYQIDNAVCQEIKLNLISIMIKHVENFDDLDAISSKTKKNLEISPIGIDIFCSKCKKLKFLKKLKCGHSICFFCFSNKAKDLLNHPSCKKIQEFACKKCFELPSDDEIFGQELNEINFCWKNVQVMRKCTWCKRELNVASRFLLELTCLHLCRDCYLDQIYMGAKKCIACNAGFKNLKITKTRTSMCSECKLVGNIDSYGFRCYREGFNLCYSCQNKCLVEKKIDVISTEINGPPKLNQIDYYINKTCPFCSKKESLASIFKCPTCENIVCENCFDIGYQICQTCNNSYKF
jgi:hypothetical protein